MKISILITFLWAFLSSVAFGQKKLQNMLQQILDSNEVEKPFTFNLTQKDKFHQEVILIYLGTAETKHKKRFKIITYQFIWGPNYHTSARIYIFNDKNQYVGQYLLGGGNELPIRLSNSKLIFTNAEKKHCDKKIKPEISLEYGLPKHIFVKCNDPLGDLYDFTSE